MGVWESWLNRSKRFREYAEKELEEGRYDAASFFAQQSAEMLLKGLLIKATGARPYSHSIVELLLLLSQHHNKAVPEEIRICAEKLERHYFAARYPDVRLSEYSKWEADEALECLTRIYSYVESLE